MLNTKLNLNKDIFISGASKKNMREGFSQAIREAIKDNPGVMVLTADLASSMKVLNLMEDFPKNFIQVGIAEQNMAGIATGLALTGKIPFITSFAIFNPGRNWEQIRSSICMSDANVKILGSHAGLSHSYDGGVAQCLEDIALTRVLPNMTVLSPCDYEETKKAIREAIRVRGPVYIRIAREDVPEITTEQTPFEIGKTLKLVEGKDVSIFSTGTMVYESLVAAKDLKGKHKIEAEVLNVNSIKPLDREALLKSASKTKFVVTVEDHQQFGGMGSAIAEMLSEVAPTIVHRIGVENRFGESGTYEQLKTKYGLSAHHIVNKVLTHIRGQNE